jgi:galactoside O-acetyltransferase
MAKYRFEYVAFSRFIRGRFIPLRALVVLLLKSLLMLVEGAIRYIPGGIGYKLRYWYCKLFLGHLGKNVLIDVGVHLNGPANISIGDYTWIDSYCRIDAHLGPVSVGKRVHIASFSIIGAREPVVIEDFVGIGAGARIYSNSETPLSGKRMSGPMVPEEFKAFKSKPIHLKKDSFVGTNSVLLPGAELGEACVVGANCVVTRPLPPYSIYGAPRPQELGRRPPVEVPDEY